MASPSTTLFQVFYKYLGNTLFMVFFLALVTAVLESVGILLLVPLFTDFTSDLHASVNIRSTFPIIEANSDSLGLDTNIKVSQLNLIFIIMVIFTIKAALIFTAGRFVATTRGLLQLKIRSRLFNLYSTSKYHHLITKDPGEPNNLLMDQMNKVITCYNFFINFTSYTVILFIYLVFLYIINKELFISLIIMTIIFYTIFSALNKKVRRISQKNAEQSQKLASLIEQIFTGYKYFKVSGAINHLKHKVTEEARTLSRYITQLGTYAALTQAIREPLIIAAIVIILIYNIAFLQKDVSETTAFLIIFYRSFSCLMSLQANYQGALEGIGNIEKIEYEIEALTANQEKNGTKLFSGLKHGIELRDLSFKYESQTKLLKNVNLTLKKGTVVGITGESGSGKSSFLNLLVLLNVPNSGGIFIDNVNIKEYDLESIRSKIGYVIQENYIFNDTIANNISLWDPTITTQKQRLENIKSAAVSANIYGFIKSLPKRFETLIEGTGLSLSGGQKQRMTIARELYKFPDIMILDEASSALDMDNEDAFYTEICKLRQNCLVVIVTHNIKNPNLFDELYQIENNQLVKLK